MGPLFGDEPEPDDIEVGTIYVLRSQSRHPFVAEHRELIHKIGVTGGKVENRIAAAEKDATYLLAGVEVDYRRGLRPKGRQIGRRRAQGMTAACGIADICVEFGEDSNGSSAGARHTDEQRWKESFDRRLTTHLHTAAAPSGAPRQGLRSSQAQAATR